ncbi:hypothetical protein BDR07DRAFT_1449760 [Suillus spraguei]|nr:hypothetical protein BDR07DRAFT_1449760 [Suillus spraguei]
MKEWNSPVHAFFHPTLQVVEVADHCAHAFKYQAKGCKVKVQCFLDKGDHVCLCWGDEVLKAADSAKEAREVCNKIVDSKGKIMYLHHQHTHTETRAEIVHWVSKSLHPSNVIKDHAFQSLMKTGRPEYHIPSPFTVSCDVRLVAKMLQEYNGKINFNMDGWTSPNHCTLVAFLAHFEHQGEPLSIPLDVIEVAMVKLTNLVYSHTCKELAEMFAKMLEEFGISAKVLF